MPPKLKQTYMRGYELYIRRRDKKLRLVEHGGRVPVPYRSCFRGKYAGVYVTFPEATGVHLMPDEIITVDEFP